MTAERAAAPSFEGFPPETFSWLAGLEADNSRDYFAANRDTYDRHVSGALEEMLEELADELGGWVRMFRQNRDVRFSPDKSPYKTTTYGLIVEPRDSAAPLYGQLSATGLFVGSGYHELAADQLTRFREAIADDAHGRRLEEAVTIARGAGVETFGEALKTAPRGYPRDHPRVHLLRHRSLVAGRRLEAGAAGIARAAALEHARTTWAACRPLNAWLDERVGPTELPAETHPRRGRRAR